jgi:hypothetical protein
MNMFELNDIDNDVEDLIDSDITLIMDDNNVDDIVDRDAMRPLLRWALTKDFEYPQDVQVVVFLILYVAREIQNWSDFTTMDTLGRYFSDNHVFNMYSHAYSMDGRWGRNIHREFLAFASEQFITIFRP